MRKLGLALLVAGVTAAPVQAGVVSTFEQLANLGWNFNACGGNAFVTCMSGSVSYQGNQVRVIINNDAPYAGDVFTAVGLLFSTSSAAGVEDAGTPGGGNKGWGAGYNSINGVAELGDNDQKYWVGVKGNDGVGEGQSGSFTFTFANNVTQAYVNSLGVGIHSQRGPQDCSTKFGVSATSGTGGLVQPDPGNTECGAVSVPEPGSLALLATGMAGMAFIGRRRRNVIVGEGEAI